MRAAAAARMQGNSTGAQPGADPCKPPAGTAVIIPWHVLSSINCQKIVIVRSLRVRNVSELQLGMYMRQGIVHLRRCSGFSHMNAQVGSYVPMSLRVCAAMPNWAMSAGAGAGAASTGLPGNIPVQPGVTDLARNAAIVNANVASNLAALGMAADVPGVRAGECPSFIPLIRLVKGLFGVCDCDTYTITGLCPFLHAASLRGSFI